jgi:sugar phosphate isomerase/epimerase
MNTIYPPLGLQLIIFGGHCDLNTQTDEVLDAVAAAGFDFVEGGARDAVLYREKLDARGLRYGGSHVTPAALENLTPLVDYLRVMDAHDISNSGLLHWNDRAADDYRHTIAILNEAGRRLRDEDIQLHYHNHDFEFQKVDGDRTGMDLLLDGLDPQAVDFCVDVAWVQKAGHDPADYLRAHAERIGYLHLKDYNDAGWAEIGQGVLDWPSVMQAVSDLPHARWAMVEQDSTNGDPKESIAISRRFLKENFDY